jgi:hypothetical protein
MDYTSQVLPLGKSKTQKVVLGDFNGVVQVIIPCKIK